MQPNKAAVAIDGGLSMSVWTADGSFASFGVSLFCCLFFLPIFKVVGWRWCRGRGGGDEGDAFETLLASVAIAVLLYAVLLSVA